jgi:hypothetical protein
MEFGELVFVFIGAVVVWWIYMMTFRTDDYMRLLKADQEHKAKRDERIAGLAKGAARFWLKK